MFIFGIVLPSGVPQEDHCGGLKIRFFLFFSDLHFPDFLQLGEFLCPLFVGKFCRVQVEVVFQKGIDKILKKIGKIILIVLAVIVGLLSILGVIGCIVNPMVVENHLENTARSEKEHRSYGVTR